MFSDMKLRIDLICFLNDPFLIVELNFEKKKHKNNHELKKRFEFMQSLSLEI